MKITFTLCGRAGSKGLTSKNLLEFCEYPLAYYSASAIDLFCKKNNFHDCEVVLSTDSKELIEQLKNTTLNFTVHNRTEELSNDTSSKVDVIKDVYNKSSKECDCIIDLDITSPLRKLADLEKLCENFNGEEVVYSVVESRRNPFFNMVKLNENGNYVRVCSSNFKTRQEAPEIFDMNASLYLYSPKFLKSDVGIFDWKNSIIKMEDTGILDIDSYEDYKLMQVIAQYLFENDDDYALIRDNIKNIVKKNK